MPRYHSSFDGAQLFYCDFVPATRPPPFAAIQQDGAKQGLTFVFLHQWPLSSRMYEPVLLKLCETYRFRCIAPDRRGFGQSDWLGPNPAGDIDYHVLAGDVVDLLEKVKPGPFIFVGASMGTGETLLAQSLSEYVKSQCKASH
jgi:non-heme chloroperoxidase